MNGHAKRGRIWGLLLLIGLFLLAGCVVEPMQVSEDEPTELETAPAAGEETAEAGPIEDATVPPRPKPGRILFLGDHMVSANQGVGSHLEGFVRAAEDGRSIETEYLSNIYANLASHIKLDALDEIAEGDWDMVILEQELGVNQDYDEFYASVRTLDEAIRDADAVTVLLMPWVPEKSQEFMVTIVDTYNAIGEEINVTVVPVGLAWQRVVESDPGFEIYGGDPHEVASANPLGTYLTAATLYSSLFAEQPGHVQFMPLDVLPNPAEPTYSLEKMRKKWTYPEEDAAFLQDVAWETVREYESGP